MELTPAIENVTNQFYHMRKFSSYGPIDRDLHYYVPRQALLDFAHQQLTGDDPAKGGHYITVWAPRQSGKSWVMYEVYQRLRQDSRFHSVVLPLQHLESEPDVDRTAHILARDIAKDLGLDKPAVDNPDDLYGFFAKGTLRKPLILILDEFDALHETVLAKDSTGQAGGVVPQYLPQPPKTTGKTQP